MLAILSQYLTVFHKRYTIHVQSRKLIGNHKFFMELEGHYGDPAS